MFEFTPSDTLYQLSLILLAGIVGGEVIGRLKLPKVTGWIFTGILIRATAPIHGPYTGFTPEFFSPESENSVGKFGPYMSFVLGYIAFTVGAALHFASLRNSGKRLSLLLLGEAIITPSIVAAAMIFIGGALSDQMNIRPALLLAAVAIAGAPGTTVLVVQEARSRGILTRTLVAAVALIDMVAVGAFAFVVSYLGGSGNGEAWHVSSSAAFFEVIHEFGLAFAVGTICAILALGLTRTVVGPAFLGPTMVAVILGSWGAAAGFQVSGILACTFAGIILSNIRHDTVSSTEAYLRSIGGVLFAAFYTLAGMKLNFLLVIQAAGLVVLYFLARFVGKYIGAFTAMSVADVPTKVRNYLGVALLPHGGVAVGLILLVEGDARFSIEEKAIVTTVGLAALAINQLLGPSGTRLSLVRAGEAGKDQPRLLDFLDEHHISVSVNGTTKEEVIRSLAAQLYTTKDKPAVPQEQFVEQVLEREKLETTCLAQGLMIPHAILEEGEDVTGILGISSKGLDFNAPDDRPVHAVLLLATPKKERTKHLEVLAAFARTITGDLNLREQLYHARSAAHAYDVLHAEEAEELNYFIDQAFERVGVAEDKDEN